jgi:lipid II isoglutaminyl synthase (glutamine-hydrolysing)
MINRSLILSGKTISYLFRKFNLGNGSTWPGHIALRMNNNFIHELISASKIPVILTAGTNGKTTTTKMIQEILTADGKKVIHNLSGANLRNGIASSLILASSASGKLSQDIAIFEVDENALPRAVLDLNPAVIVLLNLFRDQLDRYGEVRTIAAKWKAVIDKLPESTTLILNGDDPEIAYLGNDTKAMVLYFGLDEKEPGKESFEHAVDSVYCPRCGAKLAYKKIYFSHLGIWKCDACKLAHPYLSISNYIRYPMAGTYNKYNTHAAVLVARTIKTKEVNIEKGLKKFSPAFGRQESILLNGKEVKIFLSKNPTGFNESLRTIKALHGKTILLVLNDRVADGHDVSWIWDVDFEEFIDDYDSIITSGDRVYDMALRVAYATNNKKTAPSLTNYEDLQTAITNGLQKGSPHEPLYVLATYTGMLEVRKILKGRKIL